MFQFLLRVRALNRLGLTNLFRVVLLMFLAGALIAGVTYACVILNAIKERSYSPDVHTNSAH